MFPENIEKNGIQRDFNGVVIVYIILYRNAHTPYMKCTDAFSKMHGRLYVKFSKMQEKLNIMSIFAEFLQKRYLKLQKCALSFNYQLFIDG